MKCTKCGQPQAEALAGGTCEHEFPVEGAADGAALLSQILHGAVPAALAKLRLDVESGRLAGIVVATEPKGEVTVGRERLIELLDAELTRRWGKAAHGKGGGT